MSLFERSPSFTGRTDIWTITLNSILEYPFVGFGYDTNVLFEQGVLTNDPHNSILYILLTQGLLYVIGMFSIVNVAILRKISELVMFSVLLYFVIKYRKQFSLGTKEIKKEKPQAEVEE